MSIFNKEKDNEQMDSMILEKVVEAVQGKVSNLFEKVQEFGVNFASEAEKADFLKFAVKKIHEDYLNHCMDKERVCTTMVSDLRLQENFKNVTAREPYSASFTIPEDIVDGFEVEIKDNSVTGLSGQKDGNTYTLSGIPMLENPKEPQEVELIIKYKYKEWVVGKPILETSVKFAVNANSRDLWNNNPTPKDIEYYKPDQDCDYVKVEAKDGVDQKDIVAASVRGRSHAHENPGKPRDDDFKVSFCEETGWYVMAVADGAGSAKFSRQGSRIACETVQQYCKSCLTNSENLEAAIARFNEENTKENNEDAIKDARKAVGDLIYGVLGTAAVKAHKEIAAEVEAYNKVKKEKANEIAEQAKALNPDVEAPVIPVVEAQMKDYATTLLIAICKKFEFGWFVATWWVGDGAIGLYKQGESIKILGEPDEGEFGGQTRFVTMRDIFADAASIYKRLRFNIVSDFTALMLMTDGVSDAKFETDANLNNIEKWDALWNDIQGENEDKCKVELTDDNSESQYQLMQWLNFYTKSNHDDRTIAILY